MKSGVSLPGPRRLDLVIDDSRDGRQVYDLLRRELGLSGTLLRRVKWLEDGILLDGIRVTTRATVHAGQVLSVRLSDPERPAIPPVDGPLHLVYEDRDLVIVDKAAGVPSHPGPGHWSDSLGNYLAAHFARTDPAAGFHPVHRLDRGTSGLMAVAKHPYAQERLKNQLHTGGFQRVYLAVCRGQPAPAEGTIDAPIGRCPDSILKRQVSADGQRAVTHYRTLLTRADRSLLALRLETGRTHQIRVHLAWRGHPLLGDFLYGEERPELITRPALHSFQLSLLHPVTGARLSLIQPPPEDMLRLLPGQTAEKVLQIAKTCPLLPR